MAINWNQSKKYRNLSVLDIAKLSEHEAWLKFKTIRWGNGSETQCPDCMNWGNNYFIKTRKQWTCKNCGHRYSVTSSTPFSSHKLPLSKILMLLYAFISASQGLSANAYHATLGTTLKTVFHNLGKIREVLFETNDTATLSGTVHIDCAHFCGKPRRANVRKKTDSYVINNHLKSRKDGIVPILSSHPEPWNARKYKKRRILLTMSQLDSSSPESRGSNKAICMVLMQEKASSIIPLIRKHVSSNAVIMTDSGNAFKPIFAELGNLHFCVNHSQEYQTLDGVNNNMAESFFSRIRRAEFGTYNGMRPQYFAYYAAEFTWRENSKKLSLLEKFNDVLIKIFTRETSKAFTNYNHGHRLGFEYVV